MKKYILPLTLLIILLNLVFVSAVLSEGFVSYWDFNEPSGNLIDYQGINEGTPTAVDYGITGIIGNAYNFDGTADVTIPYDDSLNETDTGNFSINFWAKVNGVGKGVATFGFVSRDRNNQYTIFVRDTDQWFFQHIGSTMNSQGPYINGTFEMITYTRLANGTITLYRNETFDNSFDGGALTGTNSDFYIGQSADNAFHAKGLIDEMGYWNKTLTPAEIVELYNGGAALNHSEIITNQVNLNSPVNDYNSSLSELEFNADGVANIGEIVNMSLWHDFPVWHRNQTEILTGGTNISTLNSTFSTGTHLWTYELCTDDGLCIFSTENRTFNVDLTTPIFSNFFDNSKTLTYNGTANFNVTIENTNGTVLLEIDGVNYTATNLTSNNYNVSVVFSGDGSGVYNYTWHSWSNGFSNFYNNSGLIEYIIYPVNRVCFNTTHPEYLDKFLCSEAGDNSLSFLFNISYFRKNIFSNNSETWNLDYSGEENKTFNVTMHRYDEIVNLSVNISGENIPENVLFYGLNNSVIDRFFPGYVVGNNIFDNRTTDYNGTNYIPTNAINLTYGIPSSKTIYFWMDDNAKLSSMTFNLSAVGYGFSYNNDFNITYDEDSLLTNTINEGSYITTQGTDLKNFTYDDFEDGSIDIKRWTHGIANGADSANDYSWTIANTETAGYMKSEVTDFHEIATGTDSAVHTLENYFYANHSLLNTWTTHAVLFNMSYSATGTVEAATGASCTYYNAFEIGDVEYWRSHHIPCLNDPDSGTAGCNEFALTDENLIFTLERQSNNSWRIDISGIERNYGGYLFTSGGNDYNCGTKTTTYNYNTGIVSTAYSLHPHAVCTDSSTSLENSFYVSGLSSNLVEQIYFNQHVSGSFQNNANGCKSINSITYFHNINKSLYSRSNGTFISDSVYSASGDIGAATITLEAYGTAVPDNSEEVYLYLSADEGENWESVSDGVEHSFSNPGTQIKWRADFNITDPGYKNATTFINKVNITVESGDPTNVTFDFGDDGIIDYEIDGIINETNGTFTIDLSDADLTEEFSRNSLSGYQHLHSVPLVISSDSVGQINLEYFNLTYNPNPVRLNTDYVQDYLDDLLGGFNNISFNVESINGSIDLTDLRYDYRGGNDTIYVNLYQEDNLSNNETFNIIVFHSSFYKNLPYTWTDYIFFLPKTNSSKNITPYGQTNTIPIYNLTTTNYGGNMNLSISVNKTFSCMNLTWNTNNTKSTNIINTSWQDLSSNLEYLNNTKIWLWGDLNQCNASEIRILNPVLQIESYCVDCLWEN